MATKDHYLKSELYHLIKNDESIFDFIQESALDGLWYWDIENPEHEWMNPRFWTVLGYDPADMPHRADAWQDIINPDDLQVAITNFHAHCADPNHPYDQIVRYKHKNGSTVWIRCRGMAIRDEEGNPLRMLGAHHEVTELKEAEEQSFDMIILTDVAGIVEYVNEAFSSITGFTAEEITGQPLHLLAKKSPLEPNGKEIRERLLEGKSWQGEFRNLKKDGSYYWEKTTISPIHDDKGALTQFLVIADDITVQKETQLALMESEERFKSIFEQSRSIKLVIDQETGKIVNASKSAMRFYGYPDLKGMYIQDINHASEEEVRRKMRMAEEKKENYFLFDHTIASGEIRNVEVYSTPIRIEGRIYLFSIIHDITERVQAQRQLADSEAKFKSIFSESKAIKLIIDPETLEIVLANKAAEEFYGYSDIQSTGFTADRINTLPAETIRHNIQMVMKKEKGVFEYRIPLASGELRDVRVYASKISYEGRQMYYAIVHDITEKLLTEQALKDHEAELKAVINSLPDIFFHKDINGVYLNCNENFGSLVGKPVDRIIGKTDYDLFDKATADEFRRNDHIIIRDQIARRNEEWVTYPDRHKELLDTKKTPFFDASGNIIGLFGLGRDVTDYKNAQDRVLEQNLELQAQEEEVRTALEEKEVLLKEVHHRVKNNLQTISSLLYQQQSLASDKKVADALGDSISRVSSMALIHQFIYKSHDLEFIEMRKYIPELVNKLLGTFRERQHGIEITTQIENIHFKIDKVIPVALVINELLSNIFKYAFDGKDSGLVEVSLLRVDEGNVELAISDNGKGYPKDFNPEETKTLGMYLINNLVKRQLNGELHIHSEPGKGIEHKIIFEATE